MAKEAILGLDFLKQYEACIDTNKRKLVLLDRGTRSVHILVNKSSSGRTIAVVVTEDQSIEVKTQTRVQCALQEKFEEGTLVFFEPSEDYLSTVPVAIAGVVDVIKQGEITTQIVNPTCSSVDIKRGTVVGYIEPITGKPREQASAIQTKSPKSMDWLKKVNIGTEGFSITEQKAIQDLVLEFEDVFSHGEYDLGRTNIIETPIEIIGEKPKWCSS